jgi:hypothetical protein
MQLFYNDLPLHDYGQLVISGQNAVGEPEAAPQAWRHTMRVRIMFKETSYADNYALVQQIRNALKSKQAATLKWIDDANNELLNQTATVIGHDRPEQPNEKGTYLQTIEITFQYFEVFGATQNNSVQATYTRTGPSTPTITLGFVERMQENTDTRRYSQFRSHRSDASGRISVSGKFRADPLASVDDRRAALLAACDQMRSEITSGSDGTFVFGSFNKVVRVENFTADYDQHMDAIVFSLSASFTRFPDESDYQQAEFTVDTRHDIVNGKNFINLSGAIAAHSKSAALTKLAAIRTAVATGYTMLRGGDGRSEQIDGADGAAFIRLTFDEEFEKTTSSLVDWELHMEDQDDLTAGYIRRTYRGNVTAVGASFAAAYSTAAVKARTLGDNKYQFKLNSALNVADKQFTSERQLTGDVVVTVDFSFEYRLKSAARVYAEIVSELAGATFEPDVETISGFIIASTADAARQVYKDIRAGYSGIKNDRVTETRHKISKDNAAAVGATNSPPSITGGAAVSVNANETADTTEVISVSGYRGPSVTPPLGASYIRQWSRLDFSFSVHKQKTDIAIKYELSIASDYIQRTVTTTITGTVTAKYGEGTSSTNDAKQGLIDFMDNYTSDLGFGQRIFDQRSFSYEKAPPIGAAKFSTRGQTNDNGSKFLAMTFEDRYVRRMTGETGLVLESSVREDIECAGDRIVVQPTALGQDIFQTCGFQSGKRTVSGTVTACDETTCFEFVKKYRNRTLFSITKHVETDEGDIKALPPRFTVEYRQVPMSELVARNPGDTLADTAEWAGKHTVVSVSFEFTEVFQGLTLP